MFLVLIATKFYKKIIAKIITKKLTHAIKTEGRTKANVLLSNISFNYFLSCNK